MTDSLLTSARFVVRQDLADLRSGVDGLPGAALDWKPAGADTNSVAVLVTHVLSSTRWWLSVAVGAPLPARVRDEEFRARAGDTGALLAWLDGMASEIEGVLKAAGDVDWSATRQTLDRPGDGPTEVPAAWALLHATGHLREHVGHVGLTRQLWEAR
jgi:hypothetical protein